MFLFLDQAEGTSISGVSWVFQGTAQQNSSALTFNLYDTLNLICRTNGAGVSNNLIYVISKGTTPTGMALSTGVLTVKNIGTLVYSDVDGIQKGYENFVIYSGAYNSAAGASLLYDYRYVSVGTLKTTDSATYVCSVGSLADGDTVTDATTDVAIYQTSGGLTITVNTKSGQALSARTHVNSFLTYSAAIMGASKLFF